MAAFDVDAVAGLDGELVLGGDVGADDVDVLAWDAHIGGKDLAAQLRWVSRVVVVLVGFTNLDQAQEAGGALDVF